MEITKIFLKQSFRFYRFGSGFLLIQNMIGAISFFAFICAHPVLLDAKKPAPPVNIEQVQVRPVIKELELSGTVMASRVSQISTAVEGLIDSVYFDSGDKVAAGAVILDLDSEVEQSIFKQAVAQVRQATAELADAKRRLSIAENLAKRAVGTQNEVEARKAEVAIDHATLERHKAEQQRRAAILQRHKLRAPFSGVITRKLIEAGQWVNPGTAAFELVGLDSFRIDVPVPQDYFNQLKVGADVSVKFDSFEGQIYAARIGALIPLSSPETRTFILRVLPNNKNLRIIPGMSAKVLFKIKTSKEDVVVNRDALIRYPDGRITVWVVEKNGKNEVARERNIKIGLAFDGDVQVLSGLKKGERVVVRGNESLQEGQVIKPVS